MEDIELKVKELSVRVASLKKFVTQELTKVISERFEELERRISALEKEIREVKALQEDTREFSKALEAIKGIDRKILDALK